MSSRIELAEALNANNNFIKLWDTAQKIDSYIRTISAADDVNNVINYFLSSSEIRKCDDIEKLVCYVTYSLFVVCICDAFAAKFEGKPGFTLGQKDDYEYSLVSHKTIAGNTVFTYQEHPVWSTRKDEITDKFLFVIDGLPLSSSEFSNWYDEVNADENGGWLTAPVKITAGFYAGLGADAESIVRINQLSSDLVRTNVLKFK